MAESGLTSIDDFEISYFNQLTSLGGKSNKRDITWTFLIPVYFQKYQTSKDRTSFCVLGKNFSLVEGFNAKQLLNKHQIQLQKIGINLRTKPPAFWRVKAKGKNWIQAWSDIDPAYETLNGIFELTLGFGNRQFGWSIHPKSASYTETARWILALSKTEIQAAHIMVDSTTPEKTQTFRNEILNSVAKNAALFKGKKTKNSTKDILANGLQLYSQALRETMPHRRLIGFWQLAELLTLSEKSSGKTDIVSERLAGHNQLFLADGIGLKHALQEIGTKRNTIVHRGVYDKASSTDVDLLKLVCESAFAFILKHINKFKTVEDLDLYYQHRNRDLMSLKQLRRNLSNLISLKPPANPTK